MKFICLQNLEKNQKLDELYWKLLASLPIEWIPKVAAGIEEAKYLKNITMEELLGSLITHVHTLERNKKEK